MDYPLFDLIAKTAITDNDTLLGLFLEYIDTKKITLYPAQETAMLELFEEKNVILNTPTGSGKSLVALAAHFKALAQGKKSVYTCPIKALVNEKWMSLCKEFGPENVGLATGDASVNRDAPLLCCTAEILSNIALREGGWANVQDVVMDEFHYYADRDRGFAWQVPLLTMPQARFLLMSATLGETTFFEKELTRVNNRSSITVRSTDRPVPLAFGYVETPLSETVETLIAENKAPVYVVHFTQLEASQNAQSFTSANICTREEKEAIAKVLIDFKFNSPHGPDIKRWIRQGIGIHHAGLLPKYRILVERLAQQGLLKVICGTDTLGVGINVPIRTVLFTQLCKYDGQKTGILSARDFHQISGRAGRKGFDDKGFVVAQAPEYVIDNKALTLKQQGGKKVVKRKPPERNFVNWDADTFGKLCVATPERLISRFSVTHAMILNVLSRKDNGCRAMKELIASCHESVKSKRLLRQRAWTLFRSLIERGIVEFTSPTPQGSNIRVNLDLQEDFSMDQALSLFLLDAMPLLDLTSDEYPLEVLTLVESIIEDPLVILRKQLDRLKTKKMIEMKMDGVPYEERLEELDKLEYPKPNREWLYSNFNDFSDKHPWIGQENIKPKSIFREMYETFSSFSDYIRDYDLERAEGLLLRHLNSVYKVLSQTVPDSAKTEPVREMEVYLGAMILQIDSSILDEWNKMQNPSYQSAESNAPVQPGAEDITRNVKAFTALIRTRLFAFLQEIQKKRYDSALGGLMVSASAQSEYGATGSESVLTSIDLLAIFDEFALEHGSFRLDPEARNSKHTYVEIAENKQSWRIQQMLIDASELNDWVVEFSIDIVKSRLCAEPVIKLVRIGPVD